MSIVDALPQPIARVRIWHAAAYCLFGLAMMGPLRLDIYGVLPNASVASLGALALSWALAVALPQKRLATWVMLLVGPPVILALLTLWAGQFAGLYGVSVTPSILAQRWQLYWLLFPIGLALYENGVPARALLRTIAITIGLLLGIWAVRQLTWDLATLYQSESFDVFIRRDDLRGYRLYYPQYAVYAALFMLFACALIAPRRGGYILPLLLLGTLYAQVYSRLHLAVSALTLLIFWLSLSGPRAAAHLPRVFLTLIGLSVMVVYAFPWLLDAIADDTGSGSYRIATLATILDHVPRRPIVGHGTGSAVTLTHQDVFGTNFHPSDLGLFGIIFTHGMLGGALVLTLLFMCLRTSYRAHQSTAGTPRALALGLLWMSLFLIFGLGSFSVFVTPDSILAGALILLTATLLRREAEGR